MASFNKVILLGNLTRDPELRYTPSGTAVCEFGLAVNRRTGNDPNKDETCFVDIVVWDKQAESTGRILQKGAPALIEGRLQYDQWQDRESGQKRSRLRVVAERIQFIGGRQDRNDDMDGGAGDGGYNQQQQAPRGGYQQRNPAPPRSGGYQQQAPNGYQQSGYPQQGGGGYNQQPQAPRNNYQAPQAPRGAGPAAAPVPPMPTDAFEVGGEGAEDDIPF